MNLGCRSGFQYIRSPVMDEGGLGGQALVSHEGVADEYNVVLSPSDCGQKISEIAITGDENDRCWSWVILDERHDIHCARVRAPARFPTRLNDAPIIIKSAEFFPLCGQSGMGGQCGME
jgi:hypothetical protein